MMQNILSNGDNLTVVESRFTNFICTVDQHAAALHYLNGEAEKIKLSHNNKFGDLHFTLGFSAPKYQRRYIYNIAK